MNATTHENPFFAKTETMPPHPDLLPLALAARLGRLTEEMAARFAHLPGEDCWDEMGRNHEMEERWGLSTFHLRRWWTTHIGWALLTIEWQRSVLGLIQAMGVRRVHEVCAGRAIAQAWFRRHGVDWRASDASPLSEDVEKRDAIDALRGAELVVASWIPYMDRLDYEIACRRYPLLLVGEMGGACGSADFDKRRDGYRVFHLSERFRDVPRWYGMYDRTVLVLPRGYPVTRLEGWLGEEHERW